MQSESTRRSGSGPAALLVADRRETPYEPTLTAPTVRDVAMWAGELGPAGRRYLLLHGPGGVGKSRLARELCDRLADADWEIDPSGTAEEIARSPDRRPAIVVIDDAERRPALAAVLKRLDDELDKSLRDVKVLMLARGRGDWWGDLCALSLGKLADDDSIAMVAREHGPERCNEFATQAGRVYAERLGVDPDCVTVSVDWDAGQPRALDLQVAGLVQALDCREAQGGVTRRARDLFTRLAEHEMQHWEACDAELAASAQREVFSREQLSQAVAALSMVRPVSFDQALPIVAALLGDAGDRAADLISLVETLYRRSDTPGHFMPDGLKEHIATATIRRNPDSLRRILTSTPLLPIPQIAAAITLVSRAVDDGVATVSDIAVFSPPLLEALAPHTDIQGSDLALLEAAFHGGRRTSDFGATKKGARTPVGIIEARAAFDEFIAHACGGILACLRDSAPALEIARFLTRASIRFRYQGWSRQAWEAAALALDVSRRLMAEEPGPPVPSAPQALVALSGRFSGLEDSAKAFEAASVAHTLSRRLLGARPDAMSPSLLNALVSLSSRFLALGDAQEAVAAADDALGAITTLVEVRPQGFGPGLVDGLVRLSDQFSVLGDPDKARQVAILALDASRAQLAARPEEYGPDWANGLIHLSSQFSALDDGERALEATILAFGVCRKLVEIRSEAFGGGLAGWLVGLSARFSALGDERRAVEAAALALNVCHGLVMRGPQVFETSLADGLMQLSARFSALRHDKLASRAATNSLLVYRSLREGLPEALGTSLAGGLLQLSARFSAIKDPTNGSVAAALALDVYRELLIVRGEPLGQGSAKKLIRLSARFWTLGDHRKAREASDLALGLYDDLLDTRSRALKPSQSNWLVGLSRQFSALGEGGRALEAASLAQTVCRRLAEEQPDVPGLISALRNLSARFRALGHPAEQAEVATCAQSLEQAQTRAPGS